MAAPLSRSLVRSFRPQLLSQQRLLGRRSYASAVERPGGSAASDTAVGTPAGDRAGQDVLRRQAKRNPELYILAAVMTGAFGMAGYYFARSPTGSLGEQSVTMAEGSYPWESGTSGKYKYHPGGDRTAAPRDAPSALHSVVVPDVTLPKYLHDQFNKYDDEEYEDY